MVLKKKRDYSSKFIIRRTLILFFILSVSISVFVDSAQGAEQPSQPNNQEAFDAIFVLDTSYSMNHSDPSRIANEVIRMFMDISDASRTRIGFVAYNHQIVSSIPLTPISVTSKKNDIKQEINNLRRTGYTDLGLGLITGSKLLTAQLNNEQNEGRKPFIILLSDGETDFGPYKQGRTKDDSVKDSDLAIETAQKYGYPIYTIGLNHDGTVNPDELKRISQNTGGAFYTTSSADDLPEIFNRIFASEMRSVLMPVAGVTATGKLQEVKVEIPNSSMNEANIILLSEHPIKESQLFYSSENIRMFKSGSYTLIKVSQPQKGTATLKFRGTEGDLVKINLLGSYGMEAKAEFTGKEVLKGKSAGIQAFLVHAETNEQVKEEDVYNNLKANLVVVDLSTKKETVVEMNNEGNRLYAEYNFETSGDYEWYIKMEGPSFFRDSSINKQTIRNLSPIIQGSKQLHLIKENGLTEYDLNQLFLDENGDKMTFSIQDSSNGKVKTELIGNLLSLSPKGTGQYDITITATDNESGQTAAKLSITVKSKYTVLKWSIAGGLVLIAIGVALFLWLRPKPSFAGKLEGYFLATASGSEVPVKYWPLTSFPGRKVSLLELFRSLDVHEPLPEAQHIYFTAGKGGTLIVQNTSRCSLVRNRTPLPKNKKEVLEYNDKLYITFEDGITELELRYKSIKPNTNIYVRTESAS
ncbi:von Willebrand factor type A domain protein [compost metagenome]